RADSASGLDYYGARYYDPTLGQFTSADTVSDGLNLYAYVNGNPETFTDPSGHIPRPTASNPYLQNIINQLWRPGATGSSMDALIEEARTGLPTYNSAGKSFWHYNKVWGYERSIWRWVTQTCAGPAFVDACLNGTSGALNADLATAAAILADMWQALDAWESSSYHTGTPGQNPPPPTPIT